MIKTNKVAYLTVILILTSCTSQQSAQCIDKSTPFSDNKHFEREYNIDLNEKIIGQWNTKNSPIIQEFTADCKWQSKGFRQGQSQKDPIINRGTYTVRADGYVFIDVLESNGSQINNPNEKMEFYEIKNKDRKRTLKFRGMKCDSLSEFHGDYWDILIKDK